MGSCRGVEYRCEDGTGWVDLTPEGPRPRPLPVLFDTGVNGVGSQFWDPSTGVERETSKETFRARS